MVTDGEESLLRLNLRRVRQVVCYGRVGLTTAFLHQAAERGIEIVLLTDQGTLGARLAAPTTSDPQVRRAQYRAADDDSRIRELAATVVEGKLGNLRTAVLRAARRTDDADAAVAAELIGELADRLPRRRHHRRDPRHRRCRLPRVLPDAAPDARCVLGLPGTATPPTTRPG